MSNTKFDVDINHDINRAMRNVPQRQQIGHGMTNMAFNFSGSKIDTGDASTYKYQLSTTIQALYVLSMTQVQS